MSFIAALSIFLGFMIVITKGQKRFNWLICSILLISQAVVIISKPQLPSHRLFIICFFISIILHSELKDKKFPLLIPLLLYIVGFYVVGYHSLALSTFSKVWKPTAYLLDTYIIMVAAFWGTDRCKVYSKPIIIALYIVTLYGVYTLITKTNPYFDYVAHSRNIDVLTEYYFGNRMRITSTWSHPIAYGFMCSVFFYLFIRYWRIHKIKILLLLLFFNMLVSGSRTVFASFIVMGAFYVLLRFRPTKALATGVGVILAVAIVYLTVPYIHDKIEDLIATIEGASNTGGSSIEMRKEQSLAALYIFSQEPTLGHGPDYIQEQLMPNEEDMWNEGLHLYGFESYAYVILIERGLLGVAMEVIMWLSILYYSLKKLKYNRIPSAIIFALTMGFIFFSLSTGTLGTLEIIALFVGAEMSVIVQKENINRVLLEERRQDRISAY